jgi:secreted Zn-dependent insulinase-like peptidase
LKDVDRIQRTGKTDHAQNSNSTPWTSHSSALDFLRCNPEHPLCIFSGGRIPSLALAIQPEPGYF